MAEQNLQNHTQRVPVFVATSVLLLATLIGSIVNLVQSWNDHQRLYSAALLTALTVCLLMTHFLARIFPLKAQDRAIRSEENLRHYMLTGKLLDPRLTPLQIVALRFASDAEFPALAAQAAESTLSPVDIKKAVRTWRADTYRV